HGRSTFSQDLGARLGSKIVACAYNATVSNDHGAAISAIFRTNNSGHCQMKYSDQRNPAQHSAPRLHPIVRKIGAQWGPVRRIIPAAPPLGSADPGLKITSAPFASSAVNCFPLS